MTAPTLRLSGRAFIDDVAIFGPLSLDVPPGWTCLLGSSGVGKSTILRLFAGLDDGVRLDGTVGALDGRPLAGRVALMAQGDLLMPWLDVLGNVALGAQLRGDRAERDRARDVLARVGLADHAGKKPHALSGGQRQRAALARTLMEDRPVVLLDEPFSALDARTRSQMQDLAADLLEGRTVLHVTHDAAEAARLGDRVLLMGGEGIAPVAVPGTAPPRGVDAPGTLRFQAALLRRLMAVE